MELRDLIRRRLKVLGLNQELFAELVDIAPSQLSAVLHHKLNAPLEKAQRWIQVLKLTGQDALDLEVAMHLNNSTQLVRDYVRRLTDRAEQAEAFQEQCRARVARAKSILEIFEQPFERRRVAEPDEPYDPPGGSPPPAAR